MVGSAIVRTLRQLGQVNIVTRTQLAQAVSQAVGYADFLSHTLASRAPKHVQH